MNRIWILITALLTACSSQAGMDAHVFDVQDEDGVTVAVTSGGPKYSIELFTYEKELVLDTNQGTDALLYRPNQFMADATGTMYINDTGLASILVFDADGRYTHQIGRKGFGPGEATYWRIQLIEDGIIQLYGEKERRTTRFRTDGTLLDLATLPSSVDLIGNTSFIILPDSRRLILTNTASAGKAPLNRRWGAVIFSAGWDTIGAVHTPWTRMATMIEGMSGKASFLPVPIAFGPQPTVLYHPAHGIILSPSEQPELQIYDLDGRLTRRIIIDREPEPVTETDREGYRQALLQRMDPSDTATLRMNEVVAEQSEYAAVKAYWGPAEVDDAGYLWLDTTLLPDAQEAGSHTFIVLSPEGEFLGTTTRPYRPNTSISRGRMYVLEEDPETGEILPTVYRITPAVRGLNYPE
jgi:hypothetical protein